MTFINRLNSLLSENGITKNKLATDLGLGSGTIATWEKRGTIPKGEHLSRIANYFGVTVDYLISDSDVKEKTPAISESDLTEEELELVRMFRSLSEESKAIIMGGVRNAKQSLND